jgi:hypothetical protein
VKHIICHLAAKAQQHWNALGHGNVVGKP